MADLWSTVAALALGGVGWTVTPFVDSPFRQFYDFRSEVIQKSVLYANVRASAKESSPEFNSHVLQKRANCDAGDN
jgi:hypothetical protein